MRLTRLILTAAVLALPCISFAQMPAAPMQQAPAAMTTKKTIAPSTGLTLVVNGRSTAFTLAQLAALPHKTVTVYNLHEQKSEAFSGVSLADLLTANGAPFNKTTQHNMLRSYILAEGADAYEVIYSTVEVYAPDYHSGDVIIADSMDGQPIPEDGIRLVSSEDKHPMRWVRSLTNITLVQTGN
jgi:hypothetical protein